MDQYFKDSLHLDDVIALLLSRVRTLLTFLLKNPRNCIKSHLLQTRQEYLSDMSLDMVLFEWHIVRKKVQLHHSLSTDVTRAKRFRKALQKFYIDVRMKKYPR